MRVSSAWASGIASSMDGPLAALRSRTSLGDRLRRADAGDHILALRIHQEFAIEQLLAGGGIAGEGNAGGGGLAAIAEHHGLHVDRRAPILGNVVQAAIGARAVRFPRAEHRADRAPQLFVHVVREGLAQFLLNLRLVEIGDALQIVRVQLGVEFDALVFLLGLEDLLEQRMLHAQHDIGIHLDEAAIAVIGKARIAGELGQARHRVSR